MIHETHCKKCGHASLVHTHTDEWYLAHLVGRPLPVGNQPVLEQRGYCPLGRETSIQRIEWVDNWPRVVGGKQGLLMLKHLKFQK